MNYATPELTPGCICRERGPMASMFCMTGHMLECHHPLDCREAACGHLQRYDGEIDEAEMAGLEEEAVSLLQSLASPGCGECGGSGTQEVSITVPAPEEFHHLTGDELTLNSTAVCGCVARRSHRTPGG